MIPNIIATFLTICLVSIAMDCCKSNDKFDDVVIRGFVLLGGTWIIWRIWS